MKTKEQHKTQRGYPRMLLKTRNLPYTSRHVIENKSVIILIALSMALSATACSGSGNPSPSNAALAAPVFSTTAARNGAVILAISAGGGAEVHYTIDGSAPTASSATYQAPMLISTNLTINAIATAPGAASSSVATWTPSATVEPGALVWSDEFTNAAGANAQPNPAVWTYDTGASGWGNPQTRLWRLRCSQPLRRGTGR